MTYKTAWVVLGLIVGVSVATSVHGFEFQLTGKSFVPSQGQTQQQVYISNPSNKLIAIEASIQRRELDKRGAENLASAEDEFIVFPTQMIIQPGQQQMITIQWIGPQPIQSELAYRLFLEQLPIKSFTEPQKRFKSAAINMFQRYIKSIYVEPEDGKATIVATRLLPLKKNKLSIVLKNEGSFHKEIRKITLRIDAKNITVDLVDSLKTIVMLLPKGERELEIPVSTNPNSKINFVSVE